MLDVNFLPAHFGDPVVFSRDGSGSIRRVIHYDTGGTRLSNSTNQCLLPLGASKEILDFTRNFPARQEQKKKNTCEQYFRSTNLSSTRGFKFKAEHKLNTQVVLA